MDRRRFRRPRRRACSRRMPRRLRRTPAPPLSSPLRHSVNSKLTISYHATVIGIEWNVFCFEAGVGRQWRGGETYENLPADGADRYPFGGGPLHFRARTAVENASAVSFRSDRPCPVALSDGLPSRHCQRQYPLPGQNLLHLFIGQRSLIIEHK